MLVLGCKGLYSHPWLAFMPMSHLVKPLLPDIFVTTLLMPILLIINFPALKLRMSNHRGEKMTVFFTASKTLLLAHTPLSHDNILCNDKVNQCMYQWHGISQTSNYARFQSRSRGPRPQYLNKKAFQ